MSEEIQNIAEDAAVTGADNDNIDSPTTAEIVEIFDQLPKEQQQVVLRRVLSIRKREMYSGPLPPAEDYDRYEHTLPGAANRILEMAEKQLEHRLNNENKIIDNTIKQTNRGQIFGASVSFFGLVISFILGLYGHDVLAGSIGVTTVISLAVLFVTNREPQHSNTKNEE